MADEFYDWMLSPTSEQIRRHKLPNGLNSNDEAERSAHRENISGMLSDMDVEAMSPVERRLHAALSAIFDGVLK